MVLPEGYYYVVFDRLPLILHHFGELDCNTVCWKTVGDLSLDPSCHMAKTKGDYEARLPKLQAIAFVPKRKVLKSPFQQ